MGDIRIVWRPEDGQGDWQVRDGALLTGSDLETAVLVSLFTDRLATSDFRLTDGSDDRRGWWGDAFAEAPGDRVGSDLWQFERAKRTSAVLPQAVDFARSALQWTVEDGVVSRWEITAEWQNRARLAMRLTAYKPDGTREEIRVLWPWEGLA